MSRFLRIRNSDLGNDLEKCSSCKEFVLKNKIVTNLVGVAQCEDCFRADVEMAHKAPKISGAQIERMREETSENLNKYLSPLFDHKEKTKTKKEEPC